MTTREFMATILDGLPQDQPRLVLCFEWGNQRAYVTALPVNAADLHQALASGASNIMRAVEGKFK